MCNYLKHVHAEKKNKCNQCVLVTNQSLTFDKYLSLKTVIVKANVLALPRAPTLPGTLQMVYAV